LGAEAFVDVVERLVPAINQILARQPILFLFFLLGRTLGLALECRGIGLLDGLLVLLGLLDDAGLPLLLLSRLLDFDFLGVSPAEVPVEGSENQQTD